MIPILLWLATAAHAACDTPRSAAVSLFVEGAPCVPSVAGRDPATDAGLLRAVLDARGLRVPVATIPEDPAWTNPDGEHRFAPLENEPWLALDRAPNGSWRFSPETVAELPRMHQESFSPVSRWFQERLPAEPGELFLGLHPWQLVYAAVIGFVAILVGAVVRNVLLREAKRLVHRFELHVPDAAFRAVDRPLYLLSMAGFAAWTVTDLALPPGWARPVQIGIQVLLGFSVVLLVSKLVTLAGHVARSRAAGSTSRFDDQIVPVVEQGTQVLVWLAGFLLVLQVSGVEVWGALAGLGIGSVAVALAAQDSLANLFGALNIFLDRPFQVGDWVVIGGVEGTVEEVGFRSFRVRTPQDSLVTIPNSRVTDTDIENQGARRRRRVKFALGLTYDTPPERITAFMEAVRGLLRADPLVDADLEVRIDGLGASSIDVMLYFYLKTTRWTDELAFKDGLYLAILRTASELGVQFAYPTRTLHVASMPRTERPAEPADPVVQSPTP